MLAIADSRFQDELMRQAKDSGKLARTFELPSYARENFPERVASVIKPHRDSGLLPSFPFGSDFTDIEQRLIPALELLQDASASLSSLARLALAGLAADRDGSNLAPALARMGLTAPSSLTDRFYRLLLAGALSRTTRP